MRDERINVTKTFLPPLTEYSSYLEGVWESGIITNQGPLLKQFEDEIRRKLNVENFHLVANGTLALQLSIHALGLTEGEIITTPFSYVATTSSIAWERCKPVFVDIEPSNFCIDVSKIEEAITDKTKAIMPVHVFGFPCDVEAIDLIAKKHNLKVIYDAAHAFGVEYKGRSLLDYGDISISSFHATKLFHTIEGGGIFTRNKDLSERIELTKRFGHNGDDHKLLGINAKASELQAAMGLCNLSYIEKIISDRSELSNLYDERLSDRFLVKRKSGDTKHNYGYYPILFEKEIDLLNAVERLNKRNIFPRRYFYPSLNELPYIDYQNCPVSESISRKILCLPLYTGLDKEVVLEICKIINT